MLRKINGIILVILGLFAGHSLSAQTTVSLFKSYAGNINYIATGASLRSASNASNPCTVVTSASQSVPGMPSGSTIVAAYVYWCGSYSTATGSTRTTPDWDVEFGPLFGTKTALTASASNQFTGTFTFSGINYDYFCGRADVSSIVTASTSAVLYLLGGNSGTTAALSVNTATPHCATSGVVSGWSLVIVYSNTSNERLRVINLFDGLQFFYQSSLTLTVNNFRIDSGSPDAKITHITFEGDPDISGGSPVSENLTFKSFSASSATAVTNANNLTGNQFNSTITKSYPPDNTLVTTPPQHYGVDIDSYDVGYPIPPPASNTGRGLVISGDESAQTVYSSGDDMVILIGEVISVSNTAVADLSLSKTDNNINFVKGQTATYNFTVTNNGPNGYNKHPSNNTITVTDTLPSGLTFTSGSGAGWNFSALGQVVTATYTIGPAANSTLANGGTLNFSLSASVGSTIAASIVNTARVSGTLFDNQSANNTATDSTTVINGPNLSTSTKTVVDNTSGWITEPNHSLTYTITLNNSATYAASSVSVTDNIPANVTGFTVNAFPGGASNSSTGGGTGANGTGFLNITNISIPGSSSATITFSVTVSASATSGTTIPNTATVTNPFGPGATVNATTLTVYKESATCDIAITGTYIEAERYTTFTAGTNAAYTFSIASSVTGANYGQYVLTDNGAAEFPSTGMRLDYPVNFTATGTYQIWMRANSPSGSADSTIWGVNYAQIGALTQGPDNNWYWTTALQSGSNTVTISSTGSYTIHLWTREPGQRTDAFFIIRTDQTVPAGLSESATIAIPGVYIVNPNNCAIYALSGTVFEDINFGGGLGRSLAASSGVGITAARMELYSVGGSFIGATATTGSGTYSFNKLPAGTFTVRSANLNVRSTRSGGSACTTCIPVQTFRTNAASGTAVAVTDRVGGEVPNLPDSVDNTTLATLYSLTAGNTATPQSITSAVITASSITGINFGYNFDTIVRTTDSGQGTLRQFITNANGLAGDAALAQSGFRVNLTTNGNVALPAAAETSIFMIPDGIAHDGLRAGLTNQLVGGRALINVSSLLPAISTAMIIDGGTQTYNVGNTNAGTFGAGGTVGTDFVTLPTLQAPEVEIRDNNTLAIGFDVQASSVIIRDLAMVGFGNTAGDDAHGNIRVGASANTVTIESNVLGALATSFSFPGAATSGSGDNIRVVGGDSGTIQNNLIGFAGGNGIELKGTSNSWTISGNEIRGNGVASSILNGIEITDGTGNSLTANLLISNYGAGIDLASDAADSNTLTNNTASGNGVGGGTVETPGVRINAGDSNTLSKNILTANFGAGVLVANGSDANTITQNSIYLNGTILNLASGGPSGQIGIDLTATDNDLTGTSTFVTLNDSGDGDTGGNGLLNFPIIHTAAIASGNLTITGWARPGSIIEFFIANVDPTSFGEGQTYLTTRTEGVSDAESGTTTYGPGAVGGILQGTDTTSRYSFTFTTPASVSIGTVLTATATLTGNTSEFSGVATARAYPMLTNMKTVYTFSDPFNGTTNAHAIPGASMIYTIRITNSGPGTVDLDTMFLNDAIPANTRLFVNSLGSSPANSPIQFNNGAGPLASGLTLTFTSLASTTDDISFSNNNGTTYSYTPVPDGDGYDANVTNIRVTPKGTMNADVGSGSPYFEIIFQVRIN